MYCFAFFFSFPGLGTPAGETVRAERHHMPSCPGRAHRVWLFVVHPGGHRICTACTAPSLSITLSSLSVFLLIGWALAVDRALR